MSIDIHRHRHRHRYTYTFCAADCTCICWFFIVFYPCAVFCIYVVVFTCMYCKHSLCIGCSLCFFSNLSFNEIGFFLKKWRNKQTETNINYKRKTSELLYLCFILNWRYEIVFIKSIICTFLIFFWCSAINYEFLLPDLDMWTAICPFVVVSSLRQIIKPGYGLAPRSHTFSSATSDSTQVVGPVSFWTNKN